MYLQKVYNLKLAKGLAEETLQGIQNAEMDYAIEWSDEKQTPWESTSLTGDFFFNK